MKKTIMKKTKELTVCFEMPLSAFMNRYKIMSTSEMFIMADKVTIKDGKKIEVLKSR